MTTVRTIRPTQGLPPQIGASIFALAGRVWPPEPGALDRDQTLAQWKAQDSTHCIIAQETHPHEVLAHALIFRREILTTQGSLPIGALATVCVHPDYRGRGWGEAVVRAALGVMPEMAIAVSLFQTGVPQFYEKLGARIVNNRFFNGQNPDDSSNPFWDLEEMIYPAAFPWPEGDIDLNGEGY
ncbi:hypothetical protein IAD21_00799 [Abditibacteriota bacterium]|nr:hypothetical protein IAD21_00799 [Abditibacteriota bacterium]